MPRKFRRSLSEVTFRLEKVVRALQINQKKSPMAKSNSQQKLMNKTFNGGITSSVPGILRNSNMQKPSMKEFMNKTANSFKFSLKESKSLIDHRQLIPIQKKRSIVSKLQGKNI